MEFSGERVIGASQWRVYDALHDPVVLRQAIPGIQTLNKVDSNTFDLSATLKVGPFRPTLSGVVQLYNQDPPSGYSLRGQADSANGTAAGSAHVALAAIDEDATNLAYHVTLELEGPLASVEVLRLETTARTLTAEFFSRLQTLLDGDTVDEPKTPEVEPVAEPERIPSRPVAYEVKTLEPTTAATDATGGFVDAAPTQDEAEVAEPTASHTATPGARRLETDVYSVPARRPRLQEPSESQGGIGRWIGVAIGLLLIAALLNNNF
ncbi:CoxG family protein [Acuticoccus sediminis]|uniref:CoxG family protein n=1 Tax=Acuticoccus sediminis TaxID=2184697 RepID=UPI00139153EB|nr:carbon monoxide dehydrogenase subunit G [Acuticoccus sediminis]